MSDRTVLVIAYYFPPMGLSGVLRTVKFVKYLADYGWKPIVLTNTPHTYYAHDETLLSEFDNRAIEIYRTPPKKHLFSSKKDGLKKMPGFFRRNIIHRTERAFFKPDTAIRWHKSALAAADEIIRNHHINIILTTAPPFSDFLIASDIAERHGLPFIVDYRDSWADNPDSPFHSSRNETLEARILARAAKAVVTTRYAKELLLRRYRMLTHEDVIILPNGFDNEDFKNRTTITTDNSKFVITHCGIFQDDCTPKYFMKALATFLKKNPNVKSEIEARFVGTMKQNYTKIIKKYKLEEVVSCTGYVPHSEALQAMTESDALWLMSMSAERMPGKLSEYIGALKPMLVCSPEGTIRRTALETKSAITTEVRDVAQIEKAIATLFEHWKQGTLPKPDAGNASQFEIKLLTSDLSRELAIAARL
ncbi:MAG: glycosyltransferase [Bacteroidetes bacterium]|nr:glycosyltransferase [Bacteroidota bacterium]